MVVQIGSAKGQRLVDLNISFFTQASDVALSRRDEVHRQVVDAVKKNLSTYQVPNQDRFEGIIHRNFESEIWKDEAKTCVECGACNTICPTCHCFLLYDQKNEKAMARFRMWDSCLIKEFARVGGGANPRPKLWMRLRNRFEKKFDFFPKVAKVYACTGCGRCITACPAKIDIRRVLKRLVDNVPVS
jgi:sulfhydrogenase subunit beta (sulfur reductase)